MSTVEGLVADFAAALSDASNARRTDILQRVTDLYFGDSPSCSTERTAVFEAVLGECLRQAERKALAALSERLASEPLALPEISKSLACHRDVVIAGPLLEKSNQLADDDIISICKSKEVSIGHLMALARRGVLGTTVTDALIARGGSEVMRKLVANEGAQFSHIGFVKLVSVAKNDGDLAKLIAGRSDLPDELRPFLTLALQRA